MALIAKVTAGKQFIEGEKLSLSELNKLGVPSIDIGGTVAAGGLGSGSVGTDNIADGAVTLIKLGSDVQDILHGANIVQSRNLSAWRLTSATLRVQADAVLVKTSTGAGQVLSTVSLDVDVNATEAGDTGGVEASTTFTSGNWYYLWIVAKADGTKKLVLSANYATAPDLEAPGTYQYMGWIGAIKATGTVVAGVGGTLDNFLQRQNRIWIASVDVLSGKTVQASFTAVTLPSTGAGSFPVPTKRLTGTMGVASTPTPGGQLYLAGDATGMGACVIEAAVQSAVATPHYYTYADVPVFNQQLFYKTAGMTLIGTDGAIGFYVTGFDL